jgi:hypothetical protein
MTIDPCRLRKRVVPLVVAAPLVLALWVAVLAGVTLLQPGGRAVAVFVPGGPEAALGAVVAAGGSILEIRSVAVIAIADDPGFVRRLYQQGPVIVVATRGAGCGIAAGLIRPPRTVARSPDHTLAAYLA